MDAEVEETRAYLFALESVEEAGFNGMSDYLQLIQKLNAKNL